MLPNCKSESIAVTPCSPFAIRKLTRKFDVQTSRSKIDLAIAFQEEDIACLKEPYIPHNLVEFK